MISGGPFIQRYHIPAQVVLAIQRGTGPKIFQKGRGVGENEIKKRMSIKKYFENHVNIHAINMFFQSKLTTLSFFSLSFLFI